jgi:predicted nucleotidyltransferase
MLEAVAEALGRDLLEKLVFVGGCSTALFITDPVTLEDVRATDDVDLIIDLVGYPAWTQLQKTLTARGFKISAEDEVICRMRLGSMKVDFMPDDETILGFSNRWYRAGIETAEPHKLSERFTIRRLTPPLFLATKLEAWIGRGGDDMLGSRDLEDILLIVDGRPEIVDEVRRAEATARNFISEQIGLLLKGRDFDDFLAGNLHGTLARERIVYDRFVQLSRAGD